MIELFYSIEHLTTEQLRELYSSYRSQGWVDYEYYKLMPEGVTPPALPDEVILPNIHADHPANYFVFMQNHEDEADGIMICFGLTQFPDFGVFLHLGTEFLDEITTKYGLEVSDKPRQNYCSFGGGIKDLK
jgi:hypothetical protein